MPNDQERRRYAILLSLLTFLFVLRVLGQILVTFFGVEFLPAMEHWYSGLLPYPILLPIQILMIMVMLKLIRVRHLRRNCECYLAPDTAQETATGG